MGEEQPDSATKMRLWKSQVRNHGKTEQKQCTQLHQQGWRFKIKKKPDTQGKCNVGLQKQRTAKETSRFFNLKILRCPSVPLERSGTYSMFNHPLVFHGAILFKISFLFLTNI